MATKSMFLASQYLLSDSFLGRPEYSLESCSCMHACGYGEFSEFVQELTRILWEEWSPNCSFETC